MIRHSETQTTYQCVVDLRSRLQETAKSAEAGAEVSSKTYFDLKETEPRKLNVDEVLVFLCSCSNKLTMQWLGPYKVVECTRQWC